MEFEPKTLLLSGGLLIGLLLGAIVQATGFCFRSAVLQVYTRDSQKHHVTAWVLAILTGIAATQSLVIFTNLNLSDTRYLATSFPWPSMTVGGLVFGAGAILARGCGGRLTVLAATGNLRALVVVIVFAISAYATLGGILAIPRLELIGLASLQSDSSISLGVIEQLSAALGIAEHSIRVTFVLLALGVIGVFGVVRLRQGVRLPLITGLSIGLIIALAWWVTGVLAFDDFDPRSASAITFAVTLADSLQFLTVYTGVEASFGVALVAGVMLGSFAAAMLRGELKLQGFSQPNEMVRYMAGGVLMGFGSITALGCTFGHGLSGLSTLSIGSFIVVPAIVVGMVLMQKRLDMNRK